MPHMHIITPYLLEKYNFSFDNLNNIIHFIAQQAYNFKLNLREVEVLLKAAFSNYQINSENYQYNPIDFKTLQTKPFALTFQLFEDKNFKHDYAMP